MENYFNELRWKFIRANNLSWVETLCHLVMVQPRKDSDMIENCRLGRKAPTQTNKQITYIIIASFLWDIGKQNRTSPDAMFA